MLVSHADSSPTLYEYIMDMLHYSTPHYMKMSHVTNQLRSIVQPPHTCVYDGILGVPIEVHELCQRIAWQVGANRPPHAQLFVPLRLEHWLVHHLVTIHLHTFGGASYGACVAYYDPHGSAYEDERRVIVDLVEDGVAITPSGFIQQLMKSLPGWTCRSVGMRHQGVFSPLSCGRMNLQYIEQCVADHSSSAID